MKATLCKGVRIRQEEFGGVVLIRNAGVLQVDSLGFEILSMIQDGTEIDDIIHTMKEKHEGDPEQIEKDVYKFTEELIKGGVIEVEEQ